MAKAPMLVGYARTSTVDQVAGLEAQRRDLEKAGAEKIWSEQISSMGKRDGLRDCLSFLRAGDALVVTKPDRLARSTLELLTIEADLRQRGIGLVVLSMSLDTRHANPTSRLTLTILAAVAAWEREIMLERQREGIAKAKGEGKYKGRKPTVALHAATIRARVAAGERPADVARQMGVARSSIYRMMEMVRSPGVDRVMPGPQAIRCRPN
jgi:DNA invertase Pin-like site-specific DNA recombinase